MVKETETNAPWNIHEKFIFQYRSTLQKMVAFTGTYTFCISDVWGMLHSIYGAPSVQIHMLLFTWIYRICTRPYMPVDPFCAVVAVVVIYSHYMSW